MDEIKLLDLTRQYEIIKDEVIPVVLEIMESQRFVNGPVVETGYATRPIPTSGVCSIPI